LKRDNKQLADYFLQQWLAANMVVSSFAIGLLGRSIFFLGFADSVICIIFFNLIGVIPVCYFSTFGPRFGLRQMVLSRFWFGWWGVKLSKLFHPVSPTCRCNLALLRLLVASADSRLQLRFLMSLPVLDGLP